MQRCSLLLAVGTVLVLGGSARADDWPQFRGPTGQGQAGAERLPTEWGPDRNVAWKQPIPGAGWSSPILCAGRVYLTTSVPAERDRSLRVLCLDTSTGKVLWDTEAFHLTSAQARPVHSKNTYASATPATDGKRLYVHFGPHGTACLDLEGKVVWRNADLTYDAVHGGGGSPILIDEGLVFSADGQDQQFLALLHRETGKVIWKTDRGTDAVKRFSFATPLLITARGRRQIISQGSGLVGAYDPQTGREIWRVRYPGYSVVPRPVFGHGLLFVCTGFDSPTLLAVRPDGEGDVTASHVAWTLRRSVPLTPSPLLDGDELYLVADSGLASCLDAKTGKIHWQERLPGHYSASPIRAGGKIYCLSEEGLGVVLQAGRRFEQLARNDLDERALASYAVAEGALFVRTEKHLYRIQSR